MYFNIISFKNGKIINFKSTVPYSVDKVSDGWNVIVDESDNHVVSFIGSEIMTIESKPVPKDNAKSKKRPAIKTAVETE